MKTAALDVWWRELASGERTKTTFDALWLAACAELNALETTSPERRASYIREAKNILVAEAKRRGAA